MTRKKERLKYARKLYKKEGYEFVTAQKISKYDGSITLFMLENYSEDEKFPAWVTAFDNGSFHDAMHYYFFSEKKLCNESYYVANKEEFEAFKLPYTEMDITSIQLSRKWDY